MGRTVTWAGARTIGVCVAVVMLVVGCGSSGGPRTRPTNPSTAATNAPSSDGSADKSDDGGQSNAPSLYPVKVGNSWTYDVDLPGATGTETFTMTKVTPGSGYRDVVWTVDSVFDFGLGSPSSSSFSVTYRFNDDGSMVVPAQTGTNAGGTFHTNGGEGQVVPKFSDILSGRTISGATDADGTAADGTTFTSHAEWTSTGQGAEDVTVPAGSFRQCGKLLSNVTLSADSTDLPPGAFGGTAATTQWFAPGVGLVKQSLEGGFELVLRSTNVI
jgi:hypothetical protein